MRTKILVTGATGKTGAPVVAQLIKAGWPVRAIVHKLDDRSARLAALGAEVVVADLYDYEQVLAAMQGTTRAYFCPPVQPFMIQAAAVFAAAAQDAKLESIVQMSQWLASPAHPSLHTRQLWLVERMFSAIPGVGHTVVNPGAFADSVLQVMSTAANLGVFPNPFGGLRNAPPSNEDMARVIVAVLLEPAKHAGRRYRPTGDAVVSMEEVAAAAGRAVGRAVKLENLPPKMFLKAARAIGASAFEISNVRHYLEDGKRGTFAVNAPTSGLRALTGFEPETIEAITRRYAAAAPRGIVSKLREIWMLLRIMVTPALDADGFDAAQGYPKPPRPQLAADSEIWRREHADQCGPENSASRGERPLTIKQAAS